MQIAVW